MTRSILLFCDFNPENKGSLADYYRYLVEDLLSRAWEVAVVFPAQGSLALCLEQMGARVYVLPFRKGWFRWTLSLARIMRRHQTSLVVSYFNHSLPTLAAWLSLSRIKVVWVLYSPRKAALSSRPSVVGKWIHSVVLCLTDHVICGSEFIRQEILTLYGVSPSHASTVCLGVDMSRFVATVRSQATDVLRVVAIQRFSPPKDPETLIRAMSILINERGVSARLRFAGVGPSLETAKQLAAELRVEQHIEFMGYVDEVERIIMDSDIAVLSTAMESLGFGTLEPMAMGIPVVASDVGGIPEVIQHSANGLLFRPGDEHGLARCLEQLAGNRELQSRLATAGLLTIRTKFDLAKQVSHYSGLFERLVVQT